MKYLAILILLIISIDLKSQNESEADLIKYKIDTFNINHQEDFKRIILENFPEITKQGLDTVEIVADPYFKLHPFAYSIIPSTYLDYRLIIKNLHYPYLKHINSFKRPRVIPFLATFITNFNFLYYLIGPIFDKNNLYLNFRIYDKKGNFIKRISFVNYNVITNSNNDDKFLLSYKFCYDYNDIIIPSSITGFVLYEYELIPSIIYNNIIYSHKALKDTYKLIPWYNLYQFDERCQFVNYYK